MRVAVIIIVILGAVLSIGLGAKWVIDYNDNKDLIDSIHQISKGLDDNDSGSSELSSALKEVERDRNGGYALVACGLIAAAAVFLLNKLKRIGSIILLLCSIIPAILVIESLIVTFLLFIGGVLSFFIKPRLNAA